LLVFLVEWMFKTNLLFLFPKAERYDKSTMRNIYMCVCWDIHRCWINPVAEYAPLCNFHLVNE
jgi:hypothetical protein